LPPTDLSLSIREHRERIVRNIEIAHEVARQNTGIQAAKQKMKEQHDEHAIDPEFSIGERVWVYTPHVPKGLSKKLRHLWHGPYRIVEQLSPVHFVLQIRDNRRVTSTVHVN